MYCECNFCIYNIQNCCTLEKIKLSSSGMCECCIFISIPETYLEKEKSIQLEILDRNE